VVEGELEEGLALGCKSEGRYSPLQNVANPALFISHDTKKLLQF